MSSRLFKSGAAHLDRLASATSQVHPHHHQRAAFKQASDTNAYNFSTELASASCWSPDYIATLGLPGEIAAQAFDPVQSLLVVGTKSGSLHLFGQGPVKLEWAPRPAFAIKLLAFKPGTAFLFVIDVKDTLTVFDLSDVDQEPARWAVLSLRSAATCLEAPPAHAQAFIGFKDGTVNCFDVATAKVSPYLIPNLWQQQEDLLRRSGMSTSPKHRIPMCVDIKSHPRDLNYVLIAYDMGVVLWNWHKKTVERTFDLLLPPGAVGGSDEQDPDLFTDRRPGVTCLAWRADGLVFCVGHEDGCLSFWDVSDGDKPIQVRTMDRTDVNVANAETLFAATEGNDDGQKPPPAFRQPIYSIAWSGFSEEGFFDKWSSSVRSATVGAQSGGSVIPKVDEDAAADAPGVSVLSVLGGLLPDDAVGIHGLVFKPYEDRSKTMGKTTSAAAAAQVQRQSLRDSLLPQGRIQYPTWTAPEDFCLFSDSPYFGGVSDPTCILVLESPDPTLADASPSTPSAARSYSAYSFVRTSNARPKKVSLPPDLELVGHSRMSTADLHLCSLGAFQTLVGARASTEAPYAPIKGGKARSRLHQHANKRVEPPSLRSARILTSTHVDRSVRFWDVGSTLLTKSGPTAEDIQLTTAYPNHLTTIELMPLLLATNLLTAARVWQTTPELVYISSVSPAFEVGEVAVSLSSGECIVFRLSMDAPDVLPSPTSPGMRGHGDPISEQMARVSLDRTSSMASSSSKGERKANSPFRKSFLKRSGGSARSPGPPTDHAASSPSGTEDVSIHDLSQAPQPAPGVQAFRPAFCVARNRSVDTCCTSLTDTGFLAIGWNDGGLTIVDLRGPDCVFHSVYKGERASVLSWAVAPSGDDLRPLPRLIACFSSGTIRQYTLHFSLDTWIVSQDSADETNLRQHNSLATPRCAAVLDTYGDECIPTSRALAQAQSPEQPEQVKDPELHSILTVAAKNAAATFVNISGPRLAKVEYSDAAAARVVYAGRKSCALFITSKDGGLLAYSLPHLQLLFQRRPLPSEGAVGAVSISPDGEFVDLHGPASISIRTPFAAGRGEAPPDVSIFDPDITLQAMPSMAGNVLSSWWSGQVRLTPDSFDTLVGGPNRQPKEVKQRPHRPTAQQQQQKKSVEEEYEFEDARPAMRETNQMLQERGEALTYLNDTFNDMSAGAKDMMKEARTLAVQQAARDKFISFFS